MENIWLQLCKHGFVGPMNHLHLPLTHLLLPDLVFLVKTQWKEGDCVSFNFLQCSKLFLKKKSTDVLFCSSVTSWTSLANSGYV